MGCSFRNQRYAKAPGHQILDGLLVVHPSHHVQLFLLQSGASQKLLCQLFAATALFPQNQGLLQQLHHCSPALGLQGQKMLIDRSNQHQPVLTKGLADYFLILACHADKAKIKKSILETIDNPLTIALVHDKINILMLPAKLRQQLGQNVGRRNGGGTQMNNALALHGARLQHPLLQLQNIHSVAAQLSPLGRDGDAFRGAQNKLGVQLLLQLINMGTNCRLGKIKLCRSLRKALLLYHGNEALQLLKLHGAAPPPERRER